MSDDRKKRGHGLKINNAQSEVKSSAVPDKDSFDEKATNAYNRIQSYKERVWDLSGKFKTLIEDKTLAANKTTIIKDLEKEIIDKLVALASEMEADETQPVGLGSIALSVLLMKMLLLQRDRINNFEFEISKITNTSGNQ